MCNPRAPHHARRRPAPRPGTPWISKKSRGGNGLTGSRSYRPGCDASQIACNAEKRSNINAVTAVMGVMPCRASYVRACVRACGGGEGITLITTITPLKRKGKSVMGRASQTITRVTALKNNKELVVYG